MENQLGGRFIYILHTYKCVFLCVTLVMKISDAEVFVTQLCTSTHVEGENVC